MDALRPEPPDATANVVVAVDGPSGSGKSSVSRGVATELGLRYLDTGAMYRAMTWFMLEHGVDVSDTGAVALAASKAVIVVGTDPSGPTISVGGVDVADPIRGQEVTSAVSPVSAVPEVRTILTQLQRELIALPGGPGIVVEGRDIGTVVAPGADVKIYLTADPEARAARRRAELPADGAPSVEATRADLARRDAIDSTRATAPLSKAADAHEVDATHLTLPEVIETVLGIVRQAVPDARLPRTRNDA